MVSIPFIYALLVSNNDIAFGGFLINPIDGHSYLAKMYQGYRGQWKFLLPYSAIQGGGAYIFLFYLALGHLARLLGMPLILMFHFARLIFGVFLMWTIWLLIKSLFKDQNKRILGYSLCIVGSGLGWVAILFGQFTSDFWVAEAYPFLSIYTNPHFSLGLGLMILVLVPFRMKTIIPYLILGLLIGIVQPFAVVILLLILTAATLTELYNTPGDVQHKVKNNKSLQKLLCVGLSGGSILVYQYWIISTDPILSLWNVQNITLSPGIVDLVISFSPCFVLALFGLQRAWKNNSGKTLVFWAIISILLILVPWNLQRRFLTGLFIPLAGLSVFGLEHLSSLVNMNKRTITVVLFLLVIPTNLIVVFSGINAVKTRDPQIFVKSSFINAANWIEQNTDNDALFLTEENKGLLISAKTGRRVIYGHPFETTNATSEKSFIEEFFTGKPSQNEIQQNLEKRDVDYVLTSAENIYINEMLMDLDYSLVFEHDGISIYNIK